MFLLKNVDIVKGLIGPGSRVRRKHRPKVYPFTCGYGPSFARTPVDPLCYQLPCIQKVPALLQQRSARVVATDRILGRSRAAPKEILWILFIRIWRVDVSQRNQLVGGKLPKSAPLALIKKLAGHIPKANRLAHLGALYAFQIM